MNAVHPREDGISPRLSIGIPTYNRADMLAGAVNAALSQTLEGVEIIVSDNASSDHTSEVMSLLGSRARYIRNERNLGAMANFLGLVQAARGKYFVWLQDDDLLHHQFAERAFTALEANPRATAYAAYALVSPSPHQQHFPTLYGPPFALDWMGSPKSRAIDGRLIAPMSLLMSVAIMPVVAFRRDSLQQHIRKNPRHTELFGERTLLAEISGGGDFMVEPYVGGFFRIHREQYHQRLQRVEGEQSRQWNIMAKELDRIAAGWPTDWLPAFAEALSGMPLERRCSWARESLGWPAGLALCQTVSACLMNGLPEEHRTQISLSGRKPDLKARIKQGVKAVVPPIVWNSARALSTIHRRNL